MLGCEGAQHLELEFAERYARSGRLGLLDEGLRPRSCCCYTLAVVPSQTPRVDPMACVFTRSRPYFAPFRKQPDCEHHLYLPASACRTRGPFGRVRMWQAFSLRTRLVNSHPSGHSHRARAGGAGAIRLASPRPPASCSAWMNASSAPCAAYAFARRRRRARYPIFQTSNATMAIAKIRYPNITHLRTGSCFAIGASSRWEASRTVGSNGETIVHLNGGRTLEAAVWTFNRRCRLL